MQDSPGLTEKWRGCMLKKIATDAKSIKKDVISIIERLPAMKPGRQRGTPVGVRYSLPITFEVL